MINIIQGLVCEPWKWLIRPAQAQGHLNEQHSKVHLDQDLFQAALMELDVSDKLPDPPEIGIFPEIVGLAVQLGYTCYHCDKALSTIGSMEKHHHHSHPNQPLPDTWSQCHFQHLWSLNEPYQPRDHLLTTILNDDHQHLHFTWGSGPLRCMACTSPLGLMGFYLGCHLWKVASLLTLDARTLLCGLQNLPHLLSMWSNLWKNMWRTINQYFSSISNPKFRLWLFKPHNI